MKYGTNFAAIISKLFLTLANEEYLTTWFIHMIKSCITTGVPFSSFHFKSSSEFFLLLRFQRTQQSSSYCYTFASHACNLNFWFIYHFLLSFDYFQVTIQHDTIEVHEYCWDSLKDSSRLLLFSVILK